MLSTLILYWICWVTFIWARDWGRCCKDCLCYFLTGSWMLLVRYYLILLLLNQVFHYQPMYYIFLTNFDGIDVLGTFFDLECWYRIFGSLVWYFQLWMHFSRRLDLTIQMQTQALLIYFLICWTVEIKYHPYGLLVTWRKPRQGAEINLCCAEATWL